MRTAFFSAARVLAPFFFARRAVLALCLLPICLSPLTSCDTSQNQPPGPSATPSAGPTIGGSPVTLGNNDYRLGELIGFGAQGGSERYRVAGWANTDADGTWTVGNSARMILATVPPNQLLTLRMRLIGLTRPPELPFQPVEVFANGEQVGVLEVGMQDDYKAVIPPSNVKPDGVLRLELRLPKASTPKSLGINNDERILGVFCFELQIDKSE